MKRSSSPQRRSPCDHSDMWGSSLTCVLILWRYVLLHAAALENKRPGLGLPKRSALQSRKVFVIQNHIPRCHGRRGSTQRGCIQYTVKTRGATRPSSRRNAKYSAPLPTPRCSWPLWRPVPRSQKFTPTTEGIVGCLLSEGSSSSS